MLKKNQEKPTFSKVYSDIKGFGNLPEPEKKKIKVNKFMQILGKGK